MRQEEHGDGHDVNISNEGGVLTGKYKP